MRDFFLSRRAALSLMGGAALAAGSGISAFGQTRPALSLRATAKTTRLGTGSVESQVWSLETDPATPLLRFKKGDELQVSLSNELPAPITLNWLGLDGAQAAEPLTAQKAISAGTRTSFGVALRHPGTFLIDGGLLGDGKDRPSPARALIVDDAEPSGADRDEVLLIEDWRLAADGRAVAPGSDASGTSTIYTVNGLPSLDLKLRPNERLRLRVINGCQRAPIGLRIENHDVRVMAIDSQPAEPFLARDGQLVLAPGSRIDAFIDATQKPGSTSSIVLHDGTSPRTIAQLVTTNDAPARTAPPAAASALPSSHLPVRLDLQNAARVELQLDAKAPWATPAAFNAATPPALQIKRGRVAVIAITNPTAAPTTFRLHGHHFRLLDRLDDGWKPFWLDTLLLNAKQTQRIAFLAEYPGNWLIESVATDWAAPRFVRSYAVT